MTIHVFAFLVPGLQSMPDVTDLTSADAVREKLGPAVTQLMFPPAVSFALLGLATGLSISKPKGLTPWPARKSKR
jgi:hypothetical protein